MKHRIIFVVLFVILTLFTGCIAANAESHPDTLTGAEFGTGCSWGITDDGTLYVWPTDGNSGVLPNNIYNSSSFWPWYSNASTITKVIIEPGVLGGSSCAYMFCNCSQLQSIDLYGLDVSSVISMSGMFYDCSQLQLIDIPEWDTSNLTDMSSMFSGCSAITTLDLSVLDTSHVTSISRLFYDCASLSSLDLSDFNTSSVIYMHNVFRGCSALESINLSGWDTSCATAMDYMFRDCIALSEIDVSHFDMSLVTSVRGMFSGCQSLRMIDLSKWNTPSLVDLTTPIESWHYMEDGLFSGCINLETVDVSGINTSNVTRLSDVFYNCRSLKYLDLSSWDVSNVTSGWGSLFDYCNSLEFLDISSFDVRNMKSRLCLSECRGLKEIVLGEYNPFMGDGWIDYLEEPNYWDPSNGGWCKSKWIREDNTFGPYTSAELRENYTSAMAGKWVLEQPKDQYTVRFMLSDPVSTGSMPRMTCLTTDDFVIPENQFAVYKGKFDHWEDDRGNVYSDRGIIHSGTYVKNNVVVLTAMYSYNDHDVVMQNGSFDFSIKADEKALFSPVPASTSYQVYEQTPFGWNLIKQVGNTGVIEIGRAHV